MRLRALCAALTGFAVLTVACGDSDSDSGSASSPTASAASPTSSTTGLPIPPTTPFTYPPRDTVAFAAGEGSLTVAGDVQASARFSMTSCAGISVTAPRGVVASLVFVSDPGGPAAKRYVLDLAGMSPGNTAFPEPGGFNQVPPRRVRLSVENAGDYLLWGTSSSGVGTVAGTLMTRVGNARSGTFNLQLGFAGSDSGTVNPSSRGPVTITGDWTCSS